MAQRKMDELFGVPVIAESSYVDPRAVVIGEVIIEHDVYVAPFACLRKDESKLPYLICAGSNVQDFTCFHSFHDASFEFRGKRYANVLGPNCTMAHYAMLHSAVIGEDTFVGMGAKVIRSQVGAHCYIGQNVLIEKVDIPEGRYVKSRSHIWDIDQVADLPMVPQELKFFNAGVVHENQKILAKYIAERYKMTA